MDRRPSRLASITGALLSAVALAACSGSGNGPGPTGPTGQAGPPVLEHHGGPRRDGHYVAATLTPAAAANLRLDPAFAAVVAGSVLAQPLYVTDGPGGAPAILVATERNQVSALDAASGAVRWQVTLGAPVPLSQLPCGNIDPLGVTGTPIVDPATRTLYVAAMTTPDGGITKRHQVFALSLDDGSTRAGWPVGLQGRTDGVSTFDSSVQNQRGALALVGRRLYVPYGGHYGDCGSYHGWLVGIDVTDPTLVTAWATAARGGGAWAPSGPSSDGVSLFLSTGNTFGASTWSGGEAVIRFSAGPTFSASTTDWFAPANWVSLDNADVDIGGTGPVLLDLPGATPTALAVALGKDGKIYVLDRGALGGVGGQRSVTQVSSAEIINAAAAWVDGAGATVVFRGAGLGCPAGSGDLVAALIPPSATPTAAVRWCARQNGLGSPIVTTTDGSANPIAWSVGAEGDRRLHGFDGASGAVVFGGGGASELMGPVHRYQTPIVAGGRIYVAGDGAVYAFRW